MGIAAVLFGVAVFLTGAVAMGSTEAKLPVVLFGFLFASAGVAVVVWAALWPRRP